MEHNNYFNSELNALDLTFRNRPIMSIDDVGLNVSPNGDVIVENSILSLESQNSTQLNYFSSAASLWFANRIKGKQVLVSEICFEILAKHFQNVAFLPCKFMHQLEIGTLVIELLPSGESLGSSFLVLKKRNRSLLFVSKWNNNINSYFRKAVYRKVDRIVINPTTLLAPSSTHSNLKQKLEILSEKITFSLERNELTTIYLNPPLDLPWVLKCIPENTVIYCDKNIEQFINDICRLRENLDEATILRLKSFIPAKNVKDKFGIMLVGESQQKGVKNRNPDAEIFCSIEPPQIMGLPDVVKPTTYDFNFTPSVSDVLSLLSETGAKDIFVLNNNGFSDQWIKILRENGKNAWILSSPSHQKLF